MSQTQNLQKKICAKSAMPISAPKDKRKYYCWILQSSCQSLIDIEKDTKKQTAKEIFKELDEDYYYNNYDEKKTKRYEEIKKRFCR